VRPIERMLATARAAGCPADQVANFLRSGIVLQPVQLLASATARQCDHLGGPIELAYGGARGGGKSFWLLAQLAEDCMRFPGLKCLMLRKVGSSGKEGFEDLLPRVLYGIKYKYVPTSNLLIFPNGSRIKLGHFKDEKDVDKYLGLEYDVIGVEEATTLSFSKYRAIQTCNRTSKKGWRPRIYSTTNPGGIGHNWYKQRFINVFRDDAETTTRFIPATVADNAFVNDEYRGILDSLTGWQLRAWRYGDWDIASGQFFTTFNRVSHECKPFDGIPAGWRVWVSLDYGFKHYTVAYLLAESSEGDVYFVDEHAERRWVPERHADAIRSMLARHGVKPGRVEAWIAGGDIFATDRDGGRTSEDYAKHGIPLEMANMDRIDGAAEFMRRLGDPANEKRPMPASAFISSQCPGLLDCLPAMIHSERRPEDVEKVDCDDDGLGGDDFYDSARYGLMYVAGGPAVRLGSAPTDDYRG
jgi:phage terminase large subunit